METETQEGSAFSRFMAGEYGRMLRLAAGVTIVNVGLTVISPPLGLAVAAFGLVPIAAGVFNLCPIAPAWGGHFLGSAYCPAKARGASRKS
ncbi:MAG: DUF2892 domain-containing protein [Chloroflexi bacterium]|nr:DUF2892 domain-containing protein [Chloroflexota bacterium]